MDRLLNCLIRSLPLPRLTIEFGCLEDPRWRRKSKMDKKKNAFNICDSTKSNISIKTQISRNPKEREEWKTHHLLICRWGYKGKGKIRRSRIVSYRAITSSPTFNFQLPTFNLKGWNFQATPKFPNIYHGPGQIYSSSYTITSSILLRHEWRRRRWI